MSNETEEAEAEEMRQLMELEAKEKAAAPVEEAPQPPVPATAPEAQAQAPEPVTPTPAAASQPNADDPLKWADKKGLKTPEQMARSLQSMEEEFHRRNQAGHPGYRDIPNATPPPPPPPNWNPTPQMPMNPNGYGYPPANGFYAPPAYRPDMTRDLAQRYGMVPEDVEKFLPLVMDASEVVATRRTAAIERELADVRRQSARSAEFTQLMQDPAFADGRVQKEMHEVLKDGSLFQRSGSPYATAFQIALQNLGRKQLQQGLAPEDAPANNPPVTAGGGNGSQNTVPFKITDEMIASWDMKDQDAYFRSGGKVIPKK